jgi:hypothetical protein
MELLSAQAITQREDVAVSGQSVIAAFGRILLAATRSSERKRRTAPAVLDSTRSSSSHRGRT